MITWMAGGLSIVVVIVLVADGWRDQLKSMRFLERHPHCLIGSLNGWNALYSLTRPKRLYPHKAAAVVEISKTFFFFLLYTLQPI